MMGVPHEDRPAIRAIAEKLLNLFRGEPDRMRYVVDGMKSMVEYVAPLVEERIENPGDDFISVLASGEKAGAFTRHQVLVNCSLLLLAGHETTINLLCNGTKAFLEHRDQWDLFQEDPAGMTVRATEECLRYDPPVKSITRIAAEDVEMRDKVLKTNERIRWFISSANRDPNMFEEPDRFDITRHPKQARRFRVGHSPLPGSHSGKAGRAGGVQSVGGTVPQDDPGPCRVRVPAQYSLPLAQAAASDARLSPLDQSLGRNMRTAMGDETLSPEAWLVHC